MTVCCDCVLCLCAVSRCLMCRADWGATPAHHPLTTTTLATAHPHNDHPPSTTRPTTHPTAPYHVRSAQIGAVLLPNLGCRTPTRRSTRGRRGGRGGRARRGPGGLDDRHGARADPIAGILGLDLISRSGLGLWDRFPRRFMNDVTRALFSFFFFFSFFFSFLLLLYHAQYGVAFAMS